MRTFFICLAFAICVGGIHTRTRRTKTLEFEDQDKCPDGAPASVPCKDPDDCKPYHLVCVGTKSGNYCCGVPQSTSTTLFPPKPNYPCSTDDFMFVYDTSSQLSAVNYQKQVDFLSNRVIGKRWTQYQSLRLVSYSDNATVGDPKDFKNLTNVQDFISKHRQTGKNPSLCEFFAVLFSLDISYGTSIIFVTNFQGPLSDKCASDIEKLRTYTLYSATFVILKYDQVDFHLLKLMFPTSRLIFWDIDKDELPFDWEKKFWLSYGCTATIEQSYPCDSNILIAYDRSQQLLQERFEQQQSFFYNHMFADWTHFDGLAWWSFANTTVTTSTFGQYGDYFELYHIISATEQIHENPVLCNTLTSISNLNVINLYVILFVSSFSKEEVDDGCKSAIDAINKKVGGITFVRMTDQVNAADIKTLFSQPLIIPWNMPQEPVPPNWETEFISAYGCDDKYAYPCTTNNLFIAVDKSNYLSLDHFNKQMQFVMNDLFVDEWSRFDNLMLIDFASENIVMTNIGELTTVQLVRNYFRSVTQVNAEFDLCGVLRAIFARDSGQGYLVIFLSKFTEAADDKCESVFEDIRGKVNSITVISMGKEVNIKRLKHFLPNLNNIPWDIQKDDAPRYWQQQLWNAAFGCDNRSPLIGTTPEFSNPTTPSKWTTKSGPENVPTSSVPPSTTTEKHMNLHLEIWYKFALPVFLSLCLSFAVYYWGQHKRMKKKEREQQLRELVENKEDRDGNYYSRNKNFLDLWEIRRENVSVYYDKKLGSGAFADVFLGRLIGDAGIKRANSNLPILASFHDCEVAVKTLPPFADEWARNDFQQEINFMKSLKYHPHVLSLLGYVQDPAKPLMILEYCANNSLLSFIRKNKGKFAGSEQNEESELKVKNLVSFAWQVSNGLEYLHSLDLLHRDVACRNVLLDKDNICKISDFGLCRTSDNNLYTSKGGKLPIRWMALESLILYEYSPKSDVWSYGILLFELFSLGSVPYYKMDNEQVLDFLEAGKRLDKPAFCPDEIYEIMLDSWRPDPEERPNFTGICSELMKMLETANESYNYVDAIRNVEVEMTDSDSEEVTVRSVEIGALDSDSGEGTVRSHEIQIEMTDSDSGEVTI